MPDFLLKKLVFELRIRKYSPRTIKSYLYYNKSFLEFIDKEPRSIANNDIKTYIAYLEAKNVSNSAINLAINALKFYYNQIFERKLFFNIQRPRKYKKLPVVLSKDEIIRLIGVIKNPKHRLIIKFIYSTGVRVSEVVNVKVGDLDIDRRLCYVRQGKGKKDRVVVLAKNLIEDLRRHTANKHVLDFLFSKIDNTGLSSRTIQKILNNAAKKAGIKKSFGVHALRHSFATHMLETGIDIRYIQELLGHKKLETTQIYTKVAVNKLSELKNPLDDLLAVN